MTSRRVKHPIQTSQYSDFVIINPAAALALSLAVVAMKERGYAGDDPLTKVRFIGGLTGFTKCAPVFEIGFEVEPGITSFKSHVARVYLSCSEPHVGENHSWKLSAILMSLAY